MEEFNVIVEQTPGTIKCNLSEIKEILKKQMSAYASIIVTEEQVKDSKKELATLRKFKKAIDDRRKEIKKAFLVPYDNFEKEVNEVLAVVDEPINAIDTQLKQFEEDRIAAKKAHIKEIYDDCIEDLERFLPFDSIFNSKWTNVSTKDQDIRYDISEKKLKVKTDIDAIKALHSEIYEEIIETYIRSGNNLASAIERNNQYLADKARTVEQIKENAKTEEVKPKADTMGALNDAVNLTKTVTFIVSKADAEDVENLLVLSGISYRKVEEG